MKRINIILLLLACNLLYDAELLSAQETSQPADFNLQTRLIKVKRMSRNWSNRHMELHGITGQISSGKFLGILNDSFRIESSGKQFNIPIRNIQSIVLKRKASDLFLVGFVAVGAGALFTGIASLGFESKGTGLIGIAAAGSAIGFSFGWKNLYLDNVIPLL